MKKSYNEFALCYLGWLRDRMSWCGSVLNCFKLRSNRFEKTTPNSTNKHLIIEMVFDKKSALKEFADTGNFDINKHIITTFTNH